MLLFWRVRYLDSRDRTYKNRDLWLDTDALDPVTRTAVELCHGLKSNGPGREMLRYRHLFREEQVSGDELNERCARHGGMGSVFLHDYFEDENGQELSSKRMAEVLTGDSNAMLFPSGTRQHDIAYALAEKRPIQVDQVALSAEDLRVLGYFTRDLRKLLTSAFFREGPGTLTSVGDANPKLRTAVTDEELRSFVTVFRCLYMTREPAGFLKAVEVVVRAMQGYPMFQWIAGEARQYTEDLETKAGFLPFQEHASLPFTNKRLLDVFLYTQYAHQPDLQRARQYRECLAAVNQREGLLTWLFLCALQRCSLQMRNAGVLIADFYDRYCQVRPVASDVLASVAGENSGIGTLEKREGRERRLFQESVARLATRLWELRGRPAGGHAQFAGEAQAQLTAAVTDKSSVREKAP